MVESTPCRQPSSDLSTLRWPRGRVLIGRTCLSAVLAVSGRPSCFPAVCIDTGDVFPLRRSSGGGVPRGGEGHGPAGGAGVRRRPDHPLCHHLLLTHPGHSVKGDPQQVGGRTPERGPTHRAGDFGALWKETRCSGTQRLDARERPDPDPDPGALCSVTATIAL